MEEKMPFYKFMSLLLSVSMLLSLLAGWRSAPKSEAASVYATGYKTVITSVEDENGGPVTDITTVIKVEGKVHYLNLIIPTPTPSPTPKPTASPKASPTAAVVTPTPTPTVKPTVTGLTGTSKVDIDICDMETKKSIFSTKPTATLSPLEDDEYGFTFTCLAKVSKGALSSNKKYEVKASMKTPKATDNDESEGMEFETKQAYLVSVSSEGYNAAYNEYMVGEDIEVVVQKAVWNADKTAASYEMAPAGDVQIAFSGNKFKLEGSPEDNKWAFVNGKARFKILGTGMNPPGLWEGTNFTISYYEAGSEAASYVDEKSYRIVNKQTEGFYAELCYNLKENSVVTPYVERKDVSKSSSTAYEFTVIDKDTLAKDGPIVLSLHNAARADYDFTYYTEDFVTVQAKFKKDAQAAWADVPVHFVDGDPKKGLYFAVKDVFPAFRFEEPGALDDIQIRIKVAKNLTDGTEPAVSATVHKVTMSESQLTFVQPDEAQTVTAEAVLALEGDRLDLLEADKFAVAATVAGIQVAVTSGTAFTSTMPAMTKAASYTAIVTVSEEVPAGVHTLVASVVTSGAYVLAEPVGTVTIEPRPESEPEQEPEPPKYPGTKSIAIEITKATIGKTETAEFYVAATKTAGASEPKPIKIAKNSKKKIASASISGRVLIVKGRKVGKTKITVKSGNKKASITVTVKKAPSKVSLKDGKKKAKRKVSWKAVLPDNSDSRQKKNTKVKSVTKTYKIVLPKNTASYGYTAKKTGKKAATKKVKVAFNRKKKTVKVTVKKGAAGKVKIVVSANANKKAQAVIQVAVKGSTAKKKTSTS